MEWSVLGHTACADTGDRPFDAHAPCLVLIHGALHDHSVWARPARWFAQHGWSVLAVDLPGHGRSQGPALPDVAALADWTLALLDAAGVQRAALCGHSMGSLIALEAAARAPQRITHLVLVGTACPMPVSQALLDSARDDPQAAIELVNRYSHSMPATDPAGGLLHAANRALMQRVLAGGASHAQCEANLLHHDLSVCNRYTHGLAAAAAVTCPSTLILGRLDRMTPPRAAAALAQALHATTLSLDAGHALMQEAPDALQEALRQALS